MFSRFRAWTKRYAKSTGSAQRPETPTDYPPPPYPYQELLLDQVKASFPELQKGQAPIRAGARARWDGPKWDGDLVALRTSLELATSAPPIRGGSRELVANNAAAVAMIAVAEEYGETDGLISAATNSRSYLAFVADPTAAEGMAMLGADIVRGSVSSNDLRDRRLKQVLDTAVTTALAADDGTMSTATGPRDSDWGLFPPPPVPFST